MEHDLIKTKKKDDPSGTRTLLRLHRALEYIIAFLHKLEDIQDTDYCSVISVQAYESTLMQYHPWVVQVWLVLHPQPSFYCLSSSESRQTCHETTADQGRADPQGASRGKRRGDQEDS